MLTMISAHIVKWYTTDDGYNGTKEHFGLALVDGHAYEVYPFGHIPARIASPEATFASVADMLAAEDNCYLYQPK